MGKRGIAPYRIGQIISTVLLNSYILAYVQGKVLYQGFFKHIPQPVLNCYGGPLAVFACPMGSFQQIIGTHHVPWLVIGMFVVIGAFIGRTTCAWVCPFGLLQDLLQKIPLGPRAKNKKWISFGTITGIAMVALVLLITLVNLAWWKVFLFGCLPFTLLVLYIVIKGKMDMPKRVWGGGFLVAVGLAVFVWAKFGTDYGVVAGVFGMVTLGLTGRKLAAIIGAEAAFFLGMLGPSFNIGPFSGAVLGLLMATIAFGLVVLFDRVIKVSLPSNYLKFFFLILVVCIVAYKTTEPWFCKICPAGTLGAGIPLVLWDPLHELRNLIGWLYWVKIGILLLIVIAAIAVKRPFCRFICPIGAIYSVFNKASMLHIELDKERCNSCGLCKRVCPMNIAANEDPNQLECIRCFECVRKCPQSALKIRAL